MTRETKIGIVVAVSFLCLVGVVVATKMGRDANPGNQGNVGVKPVEPKPPGNPPPNVPDNPAPVVQAGGKAFPFSNDPPARMPAGADNNAPLIAPLPNHAPLAVAPTNSQGANVLVPPSVPNLPPLPAPTGDPVKDLSMLIAQQNGPSQSLPPLPPPPAAADPFKRIDDAVDGANKRVAQADQGANKVNDLANQKANNFANNAAQGANEKLDDLFTRGNGALSNGLAQANQGLDNVNKQLTLPPPPVDANPPPVPPLPATTVGAANNPMPFNPAPANPAPANPAPANPAPANPAPFNPAPVVPAPVNPMPINPAPALVNLPSPNLPGANNNAFPNLPPVTTAPNNSFPPAVIPAPTPATPNQVADNRGFQIPAPARASDVKVTSFESQTYQAQGGETFAALSKHYYKTEKYASALLAFNRDYQPTLGTMLQKDQKVRIPDTQYLQNNYAAMIEESRPVIPSGGSPLINVPVPLTPNRAIGPTTPTTDVTKNYRVPAQGQMVYEMAVQTLGDGNRWVEIYRLNPNLQPLQPIPGGTVLRLPGNANVP